MIVLVEAKHIKFNHEEKLMAKRRNLNPAPEQFLLIGPILKLTGKSRATVHRWCKSGNFPKPYKVAGSIMWKRSDYDLWSKQLQKVNY